MSSRNDPLGDRMKASYENATRYVLPRRTYSILRLDGRAFHTLTKDMKRPFDSEFALCMDAVAAHLCIEAGGSVFAYVQSDEISILMQDFESTGTQPWFGGNIQKIVSVSAGIASTVFTRIMRETMKKYELAHFDARIFTIADPIEVANYFLWRQRDAVRNSISMAAQAAFPHKELHGLTGNQLQEKLFTEKDINWNDYPDGFKRGRITFKETYDYQQPDADGNEIGVTRTRWITTPAPHFTCEPGGWLAKNIPALPTLSPADDRSPA